MVNQRFQGLGGDGDQLRLAGLEELRLELERQLPTEPEPAVEPAVEPKGRRQDLELEERPSLFLIENARKNA